MYESRPFMPFPFRYYLNNLYFLKLCFVPFYLKIVCESYIDISLKKWSAVAQLCPTLCDPMDCSLSGSFVHGVFQARVLEWIAISFSRGSSQSRNRTRRIAGRCFTVWATREAIDMDPPWVYILNLLSTSPSPYHPSGSSQCTSPEHPVSCIKSGLTIHFIYDIIHVSMPFSQIIPPSPSPTESKRLFCTAVSLLLSCVQGYHYHLSKFHIC